MASVSTTTGYALVPTEYEFQDNGIDPQQELFRALRKNAVFKASSGCFSCLRNLAYVIGMPWTLFCSVRTVKPMYDTVVARCGVVDEVLREPGPYCLNPCCMETVDVYMGLSTVELDKLPINDSQGNPLIISAQAVYRVADSVLARFRTSNLERFLKDMGGSALRIVCGRHPFDVPSTDSTTDCLRKHSAKIDSELKETLQVLVKRIGIIIESFMFKGISMEQHMEKLLLARQEAQAELTARKTIADGVSGIMEDLVNNFKKLNITFEPKELNQFSKELTLILVNHGNTTINLIQGGHSALLPQPVAMTKT